MGGTSNHLRFGQQVLVIQHQHNHSVVLISPFLLRRWLRAKFPGKIGIVPLPLYIPIKICDLFCHLLQQGVNQSAVLLLAYQRTF